MARYKKITVAMWGDVKFRALSPIPPCGQGLWFYLLTGRETNKIPGLIPAGAAALAESLRWSLEAFREAFREVLREGLAEADWSAPLVWIPNAIRHNAPESPNVVRGWRAEWDEIPECPLKARAWRSLEAFLEGFGKGFGEAFREACRQPSPNQEQEQEQEQRRSTSSEPAEPAAEPPAPPPPVVARFPCVGRGPRERAITEAEAAAWQEAFPGVDVLEQLRRMAVWLQANRAKRKTHAGVPRFVVNWLSKQQDTRPSPRGKPNGQRNDPELLRALAEAEAETGPAGPGVPGGGPHPRARGDHRGPAPADHVAAHGAPVLPAQGALLGDRREPGELQDGAHVEPRPRPG